MGRARGFISSQVQRLTQPRPTVLRVNSEQYDDLRAARLVRRLTKQMRQVADQRAAVSAAQRVLAEETERALDAEFWSYLVNATLAEMEEEAAAEQRLMELRIALLQVQPACRRFLADVRQMVVHATADEAVSLLKYAVAWRRVFGSEHANRLQAILDLAAMGAALRNHVDADGHETVYVATSQDLEAFRWGKRGAMEPSETYIGSGYAVGRGQAPRADAPVPLPGEASVDLRGVPVTARATEPPTTPAQPPVAPAPSPPDAGDPSVHRRHGRAPVRHEPVVSHVHPAHVPPGQAARPVNHPHVSVPHPLATEPVSRADEPHIPDPAQRPLLRRMASRMDGIGEGSGARRPPTAALPPAPPRRSTAAEPSPRASVPVTSTSAPTPVRRRPGTETVPPLATDVRAGRGVSPMASGVRDATPNVAPRAGAVSPPPIPSEPSPHIPAGTPFTPHHERHVMASPPRSFPLHPQAPPTEFTAVHRPEPAAMRLDLPENLPSAAAQVDAAVRGALADMTRFTTPRSGAARPQPGPQDGARLDRERELLHRPAHIGRNGQPQRQRHIQRGM